MTRSFFVSAVWFLLATSVSAAPIVKHWEIAPTSLVSRSEPALQRIDLSVECGEPLKACVLRVSADGRLLAEKPLGALKKGTNSISVRLPEMDQPVQTRWVLSDSSQTLAEKTLTCSPPRHWKLYVIKSAHIDIGLHDSQYIQRALANGFIDGAKQLADQTADWPDASRYRYLVEGLWWWLNYPQDRSESQANAIVENYVRPGLFGIGASHSGNHPQVYGVEELCRSAYYAQQVRDRWHLPSDTMLMVDNNGITWPLVTAYADAGIKNLAFLPNAWNPKSVGGSRIDVGWDSPLPHVFYWQGPDRKSRLLVWTNRSYTSAGTDFGLKSPTPEAAAPKLAQQLAALEARYPYDVWLISHYWDNEAPTLDLPAFAKAWNAQWRWPELRTVGDLSEPFREVETRFGDKIPTLRGDITGGWAQHPLSTPQLLAMKRDADRLLPTAEKLATLARLTNPDFIYPTVTLRRAWDTLISNDEHGYGTSYYSGRKVYDTWAQKRDWIERSLATATSETARALKALASQTPAESPSIFVFNPTLHPRVETVTVELPESCAGLQSVRSADGTPLAAVAEGRRLSFRTSEIPSFGYAMFQLVQGTAGSTARQPAAEAPFVENDFFHVAFAQDGTIRSIFDKQLGRELVDTSAPYRCNQLVYTKDAHKTFSSPTQARFEVERSSLEQTVIARIDDPATGAAIEQRVTLPAHEKRIDIDNRLDHVRDLTQKDRWYRFGYYAFPFAVPQGRFQVELNGCIARPHDDQTGHGTEAYLAARHWAEVGNDQFGVTLVQHDSHLVECGKIHADKKEVGQRPNTSHLYSYLFTDWLYGHAHVTGPSHLNLRYRYTICSHAGNLRDARVAQFAERVVTPVLPQVIPQAQKGTLPAAPHSFLSVDSPNVGLLALKLSETPGRGVIARFHETDGRTVESLRVKTGWGTSPRATCCSITEQDRKPLDPPDLTLEPFGYSTVRFEGQGDQPATPELTLGQHSDRSVTLQWKPLEGVRQYHLYRGDYADFQPDVYHLLATTSQTQFTDDWLSPGTTYYYRVTAAADDTRQGAVSECVRGTTDAEGSSPPARVGTAYTGLISDPRAWRSDTPDLLYLLWGQNTESDLSHYEVFRSETRDFEPSDKTFLATVQPGPYVVVPFEDKGLKPHTTYYYRIRAVDRDGHKGTPSDVCVGITREP